MREVTDISVSQRGQIVIPARIREKYGIQPGTKVRFIERDGEVAFQPLAKESVREACGMLKSKSSASKELLRQRAKEQERENEKANTGHTR